jgi:GPH family glycoside/pentoside/hexuronide:cation symporter
VKKEKKELTFKHKLGYSLGDAGGCMTFALMGSTFSMYCTDALKVNPVILAILLLVWNIWDFINDPIMGALMDKSFARNKNPKGKFRPWLLRSAPLICITFIALWSVPQFFDGLALLCCLFGLKILYEATYTMFNIPMGSLLSAMSNTDEERASLSSARGIGSGIGNMLPMVIMPQLIKMYGQTNATGYAIGAIICGVLGFVMCFFHYRLTEERNVVENQKQDVQEIKVTDILKVFIVNKPFLALCVHGLFICLMQYISNTLNNYMYSSVLGDLSLVSYGTMLSAPFMILIFVFGSKLAKKLELVKLIRYSLLIGSLLYISLFALHMICDVNPWVHIIWSGVAMGIASVSIYLQWGLVGDAIDYNERITGKRTEGSIYGTFNLSRRVGQTIGNSAAMLLLSLIGYNADLPVQSDLTITGLKTLCVLLPGIFILGSWAAFKFIWSMKKETKEIENSNDSNMGL